MSDGMEGLARRLVVGHKSDGRSVYDERVETLIQAMLADDEVRLPGERRRKNRERAEREGVAVPPELMAKIRALAGETSNA